MRKKGGTLNIYRVYITLKGFVVTKRISIQNQGEAVKQASGWIDSLSG